MEIHWYEAVFLKDANLLCLRALYKTCYMTDVLVRARLVGERYLSKKGLPDTGEINAQNDSSRRVHDVQLPCLRFMAQEGIASIPYFDTPHSMFRIQFKNCDSHMV